MRGERTTCTVRMQINRMLRKEVMMTVEKKLLEKKKQSERDQINCRTFEEDGVEGEGAFV